MNFVGDSWLGQELLRKLYLYKAYEKFTEEGYAQDIETFKTQMQNKKLTKEVLKDYLAEDSSRPISFAAQAIFFGTCFMVLAVRISMVRDNGLTILLGCFLWAARCNWIYGHPWLYDIDPTVGDTQALTLLIKYYGVFGSLVVCLIGNKIIPGSSSVQIFGPKMLTEDRAGQQRAALQMERVLQLKED